MLAVVLSQVDWALFVEILLGALPGFVFLSLILFLMEGVFTSLRFYLLTPGDRHVTACFSLTAWYVVLLVLLPLRLGEVAVVLLMKKYLDQDASPALMNVFVQSHFPRDNNSAMLDLGSVRRCLYQVLACTSILSMARLLLLRGTPL